MPRSEDFTQAARRVVDRATGTADDKRRDPAAVALGRKGGLAKAANERARREQEAKNPSKH